MECPSCMCWGRKKSFIEQRGSLKQATRDKKLKDLTLAELAICSSHNSFLMNVQNTGVASIQALDNCLKYGARCLELDIYQRNRLNADPEPVVAHGLENYLEGRDFFSSTYLNFDETVKHLAQTAFRKTSDPLILCLEMNVKGSEECCNRVVATLKKHFQNKIVSGRDSEGVEVDVPNMKLKDLKGRVIIIPKTGSYTSELANISYTKLRNNNTNFDPSKIRGFQRIYPAGDFYTIFLNNVNVQNYKDKANMVAMNFENLDQHLEDYLSDFGRYSFRPKDRD